MKSRSLLVNHSQHSRDGDKRLSFFKARIPPFTAVSYPQLAPLSKCIHAHEHSPPLQVNPPPFPKLSAYRLSAETTVRLLSRSTTHLFS